LFFGSVGYLAIAFIVLFHRTYVAAGTASAIARLTGLESRVAAALATLRRVEDALLFVLRDRPGPAARLAALECLAHFLLLFETYWALNSMGVVVSFVTAALVEILTKLANVASAGVTEGAYAFLFKALMLPPAAGFTLSLVKRLRSLALAAIGLGIMTVIPDRARRSET